MEVTKESWDAVVKGQLDDLRRINDLQARLCRMARKTEEYAYKLVTVCGWLAEEEQERLKTTVWSEDIDSVLSDVDDSWYEEELDRFARKTL
jgi:hypothetical protein